MLRYDFEDDGRFPAPTYEINFSPKASADITRALAWYHDRKPSFAARWYSGLILSIKTLATQPASQPIAAESVVFGEPVRRLLYKNGRTAFHVFYAVYEPLGIGLDGVIRILKVRNAVMRPLADSIDEEIDEPDEL